MAVFLEFIGEIAVVSQGLAAGFQLLALTGIQVVAVDDELQVAARCHEGIAETESFLVKSGTLATYIYFITLQDEKIDMMLH